MNKALRWVGYALGGLLVLVLIGIVGIYAKSNSALHAATNPHPEKIAASSTPLSEARRQMVTLGCTECHGANLQGRKFLDDSKLAVVWAPNLTQVAAKASDQQLASAIRQGIGADGRPLFVMPSVQYRHLTDAELGDIIRAIRSFPRGGAATPPIALGPLGRIGVAAGKLRSQPAELEAQASMEASDFGRATAYGRHLVMTHCSDCHGALLTGAEPQPGIVSPDLMIAGAYDEAAFASLLRTGRAVGGRKLKLMGDVAPVMFPSLTPAETKAMHDYLVERAQRLTP
jgi:mono/diheme cytochrome c family protein